MIPWSVRLDYRTYGGQGREGIGAAAAVAVCGAAFAAAVVVVVVVCGAEDVDVVGIVVVVGDGTVVDYVDYGDCADCCCYDDADIDSVDSGYVKVYDSEVD
jgi:hypothetical protein